MARRTIIKTQFGVTFLTAEEYPKIRTSVSENKILSILDERDDSLILTASEPWEVRVE